MPRTLLRLLRDLRFLGGAVVLLLLVLLSTFPRTFSTNDPLFMQPGARLQGPSADHLLGTDEFGRDLLGRLVHGTRATLIISVCGVGLALGTGFLLGCLAAYFRGYSESIIMRAMDFVLSFPAYVLGIGVLAFLGASMVNVILVIGILYTPQVARLVYGSVLGLREKEYTQAAHALGARPGRILARHIAPNILAPVIIQATVALSSSIHLEAGLSFLGLGPPPPLPVWGRMVAIGRQYWLRNPIMFVAPAACIALTIVALNLLGDALRDHLDPRLERVGS